MSLVRTQLINIRGLHKHFWPNLGLKCVDHDSCCDEITSGLDPEWPTKR